MIRCNNCGADIEETQTQCPYCHAMQYEASEKEYMNHLYKMNDTMDGLMKMQTVISGTESFVMLSLRWRRLQQHCLSGLRGDIQNIVLIIIRLRNAERLQRAWHGMMKMCRR